jgi:Na+/proline symporter
LSALLQAALPNAARPAVVAVGILYFAVVLGISIWAARRTHTARDFFVAGKGIGLIALTVASVSVSVSGFAFIGGPGFIYAVGLGAMYIVLPAAVTNVMGAWVLAKRMRLLGEARGLITIPDAIGARYRSRGAQGLSAIAILVGIVGYMATNALAMGVVINSIFGVGLVAAGLRLRAAGGRVRHAT